MTNCDVYTNTPHHCFCFLSSPTHKNPSCNLQPFLQQYSLSSTKTRKVTKEEDPLLNLKIFHKMMHSNNRSNDHCVQPVKLPQISDEVVELQEVIDPSVLAKLQHSDDDEQVELQGSSPTAVEKVDRVQQIMKTQQLDQVEVACSPCLSPVVKTKESANTTLPEVSGREKLKRHRTEVAAHVWIPDIWGQEELLKDWIDCSAFDAALVPSGLMSARAALVQEARRTSSGGCVKS